MRLLSYNCRRLEGAYTISQLKESQRLYLSDMTVVCETKQKSSFVKTVCGKLKCKENWGVVNLISKKGGLQLFWGDNISICKIEKREFSIEAEVERKDFQGKWWLIFVYLSLEDNIR